jgi:hypothetical protein
LLLTFRFQVSAAKIYISPQFPTNSSNFFFLAPYDILLITLSRVRAPLSKNAVNKGLSAHYRLEKRCVENFFRRIAKQVGRNLPLPEKLTPFATPANKVNLFGKNG